MRCICGCGTEITKDNQGVNGACADCTLRLRLVEDGALSMANRDKRYSNRGYVSKRNRLEMDITRNLHGTILAGRHRRKKVA